MLPPARQRLPTQQERIKRRRPTASFATAAGGRSLVPIPGVGTDDDDPRVSCSSPSRSRDLTTWFEQAKLMSGVHLESSQLLRLDLAGAARLPQPGAEPMVRHRRKARRCECSSHVNLVPDGNAADHSRTMRLTPALALQPTENTAVSSGAPWADWLGWNNGDRKDRNPHPTPDNDDDLPSVRAAR